VCDLETSRMGAPYIYDISRLRVNHLSIGRNVRDAISVTDKTRRTEQK